MLPDRCASASRRSRSCAFAPTPPATTRRLRPVASSARCDFVASTSTIASTNARAMSARPCSHRLRCLARGGQHGGFQAAEAEVEIGAGDHRSWQPDRPGDTEIRESRHRGTARIAEPEQLRRLVESFAGGVVERFPEQCVAAPVVDAHQLRVATGHQQRHERELRCGLGESSGESRWPSRWCTGTTGRPSA